MNLYVSCILDIEENDTFFYFHVSTLEWLGFNLIRQRPPYRV